MMYRISRSSAAGSSGSTASELWTENPECRVRVVRQRRAREAEAGQ